MIWLAVRQEQMGPGHLLVDAQLEMPAISAAEQAILDDVVETQLRRLASRWNTIMLSSSGLLVT